MLLLLACSEPTLTERATAVFEAAEAGDDAELVELALAFDAAAEDQRLGAGPLDEGVGVVLVTDTDCSSSDEFMDIRVHPRPDLVFPWESGSVERRYPEGAVLDGSGPRTVTWSEEVELRTLGEALHVERSGLAREAHWAPLEGGEGERVVVVRDHSDHEARLEVMESELGGSRIVQVLWRAPVQDASSELQVALIRGELARRAERYRWICDRAGGIRDLVQ